MTPIFLPHTALDAFAPANLSVAQTHGRSSLRALRDRALAEGAHVLLLVWPTFDWALLAVEVPPGVVVKDAAQLIPNLLANPDALAQMQRNAHAGNYLNWLHLIRPANTTH